MHRRGAAARDGLDAQLVRVLVLGFDLDLPEVLEAAAEVEALHRFVARKTTAAKPAARTLEIGRAAKATRTRRAIRRAA
ncbi:MAG: hypothetical protein AAFR44_12700 [Pseudomonadota bacterium]